MKDSPLAHIAFISRRKNANWKKIAVIYQDHYVTRPRLPILLRPRPRLVRLRPRKIFL